MKIRMKYFSLLLCAVSLISLTGCEINIETDDYDTSRLCNVLWVDEWSDNGYPASQKIIFYADGTGMDRFQVANINNSYNSSFYWHWDGERNIVISYGSNDVVYFDDVQISSNRLSGYLNDEYVEFIAY